MEDKTPIEELSQADLKKQLTQAVMDQLSTQETSITKRNDSINLRYDALYSNGLYKGLPIKRNSDDTQMNLVRLVPEIMTNQLFGRGFQVSSTYDNKDLSPFDMPTADPASKYDQQTEKDQTQMENARRQADANVRANLIRSINEDNQDLAFFNRAGKMQSYAGFVVIKHWLDKDEKRYRMVVLENPNNYYVAWSDSDFREKDWDGYVDKISLSSANRKYGKYLDDEAQFTCAADGASAWQTSTAEDLNNTPQKMVWVTDISGYIPGFGYKKGKLSKVKHGNETELGVLIVGNQVVDIRDKNIGKFELVNNIEIPLQPYGQSDVTDDAISINRTIVQLYRSWTTLSIKSLYYKLKFKGFEAVNIPQSMDMEVQGIPLADGQDIDLLQQPQSYNEFRTLIEEYKQDFTRVTRIGQVMFNDPTAVSNSNQAMMTGMKPLTDVIEEKQSRWQVALKNIYTRALAELSTASFVDKETKKAITDDPTWKIKINFPSVLRKEDNAWQTLWANLWNSGSLSWQTYMQMVGPEDTSEELDRIRQDLANPATAAMMSKQLGLLTQAAIQSAGANGVPIPPQPDGLPQPDGNTPGSVANPMASPDMNAGPQPVSVPGSGATAVSPEGAVAMAQQQAGV